MQKTVKKNRKGYKNKPRVVLFKELKDVILMENTPCEYRFPGMRRFIKCPFFEKCKVENIACKVFDEFVYTGNIALNWSHPPDEKIYNRIYNVICEVKTCKSRAISNGKCAKCLPSNKKSKPKNKKSKEE